MSTCVVDWEKVIEVFCQMGIHVNSITYHYLKTNVGSVPISWSMERTVDYVLTVLPYAREMVRTIESSKHMIEEFQTLLPSDYEDESMDESSIPNYMDFCREDAENASVILANVNEKEIEKDGEELETHILLALTTKLLGNWDTRCA